MKHLRAGVYFHVGMCRGFRQLPTAQFDSIVVAGTVEAALAREGEARAQAEVAALRRESDSAWHQLRERQEALQSLEVRDVIISNPVKP